jgi:hypothetical protein
MSKTLTEMVGEVMVGATKKFAKKKQQAAGRSRDYLTQRDIAFLRAEKKREEREIIKDAAYLVMEQAYLKASGNGADPANARQVMYAARPMVLQLTGGKCWKNSAYFTQTLLPDFVEDHPDLTANWDVVYDARGHFVEPHTGHRLGLGTLEVRGYIGSWIRGVAAPEKFPVAIPADAVTASVGLGGLGVGGTGSRVITAGPANRYAYALFVEKEGFDSLLQRNRIAERYDLAIFSTKGMSVVAARSLVDYLSQAGVTILVLHDFDLPGLTIQHTLCHDSRRYRFQAEPEVIDIGLRLEHVTEMNLQSEPVEYHQTKDPRDKFWEQEDYDATAEELAYLVEKRVHNKLWIGKRVELNAMTSPQFIEFLERQLTVAGVTKVVPDKKTLAKVWQRDRRERLLEAATSWVQSSAAVQAALKTAKEAAIEALRELHLGTDTKPPKDLADSVREYLDTHPLETWEDAVKAISAEEPIETSRVAAVMVQSNEEEPS